MAYSQLDNLMKIPKKGDASKEKKEEYRKIMFTLLSEDGYTPVAERYFFEGFSFCGALPVFDYIQNLDDTAKFKFITEITRGTMYDNNEKGTTLKILIHLLSLFIVNSSQNFETIGLLVRCIPSKAKTKTGKISNDLSTIIEKYFVSELRTGSNFPDLQKIFSNNDMQTEFTSLFTDALRKNNAKKEINPEIYDVIFNWLGTKKLDLNEQGKERNQQIPKVKFNVKSLLHFEETLKSELIVIPQVVEYVANLESELSKIEATKSDVTKKYNLLDHDKKMLEENNAHLKTSNESLTSENRKIRSELNRLNEDITSQKKEILSLKEESDNQKSIISTYSSDKQNSLNEQLNGIASKLKTHYLNYKDAAEMQMNLELGENLRNLMGDIFKTLAKSGIDIEGRIFNG